MMEYGALNSSGATFKPSNEKMTLPSHSFHNDNGMSPTKNHQVVSNFSGNHFFRNYNFVSDGYNVNKSPISNHTRLGKPVFERISNSQHSANCDKNSDKGSERDDEEPVDCADCNKEFSSLQEYMDHPCKGAKLAKSSTCNADGVENDDAEIETFNGKIVYNPDGSAYIIEDDSSLSDIESLDIPRQEGSIVDARGVHSPSMKAFPQIANAVFVPRNTTEESSTFSSVPKKHQHPIMHSYRVYDVRGKNKNGDISHEQCDNKAKNKVTSVPTKPILMCFICKLSFGNAKSFTIHSISEHTMNLLEEEYQLLSEKNISAIIQGIGKSKEPLMSFLEVNCKADIHSSYKCNSSNSYSSTSKNSTKILSPMLNSTNVSYVYAKPNFSPSGDSSDLDDYPVTSSPVSKSDLTSSPRFPSNKSPISSSNGSKTTLGSSTTSSSEGKVTDSSKSIEDGASTAHVFSSLAVSSVRDSINAAVVNALISSKSSQNSDTPSSNNSASAFSSTDIRTRQTSPVFYGACDEHPNGRAQGVECPKCDLVLSSSQSLGGHMTMMHSRNSCKTLKCPKCNWHYKYQETLEIHMKEKHPDSDAQCIYCLANQQHPRLARGESYSCGYKPYRCEVCNYSTTTKGNLSIHMQSDKHINNVQELANGGDVSTIQQQQPPTPTPSTAEPVQRQKPKPKPTWRCDVCNYETNVARNLRIHMTSEKHTHNMMVLQQNMKHMQQDMQLQMNQMMILGQQDPAFLAVPSPMTTAVPFAMEQGLLMAGGVPPGFQMPVDMRKDEATRSEQVYPEATDTSKLFHCCVCNTFCTDTIEALHQHLQQDRTRHQENEIVSVSAGTYMCNLCTYKTNLKANFQLHCKTDKHLQRLQLVNHIKEGGSDNEWRLKYLNASNPVQIRCNACDVYTNSIHKMQVHMTTPRHESSAQLFRHLQIGESKFGSGQSYYQCSLCEYSTKAKINLIHHVGSVKHIQNESMYRMQLSHQGKLEVDLSELFLVKEYRDSDQIKFDDEEADCDNQETNSVDESDVQEARPEAQAMPEITDTDHINSTAVNINNNNNINKDEILTKSDTPNSISNETSPTENIENAFTGYSEEVHMCPHCSYTSISQIRIQAHILTQHSQQPKEILCPLCQDDVKDKAKLELHLVQIHNVTAEGLSRLVLMVDHKGWSSSIDGEGDSGEINMEVLEAEATRLAVEDAIDTSQPNDKVDTDNQYRCQTCSKTFSNIDGLYAHQNELGHLELKQTPRGPGYLCWKKGCNQYFKTAQALQVHFREIHAKKQSNIVLDKSIYRHKCGQCSLAFKSSEKLQLHSQYHLIQAATRCNICSKTFKSIPLLRNHIEHSHIDISDAELQKLCDYSTALFESSCADNMIENSEMNVESKSDSSAEIDINANSSEKTVDDIKQEPDSEEESMEYSNSSDKFQDDGCSVKSENDSSYKEQQFLEDYMNSPAMAEGNYEDPARKYKCHRCRVAFTKQNYLTAHNKTLQHRKGDKLSYPMEKFLDPNRPFKCDICKESFTQKNILLVHFNSVSHLHKVKQSVHGGTVPQSLTTSTSAVNTTVSTPSPVTSSPVTTNGIPDTDKRPYRCNICKVSYSQGSTLDIHVRSVAHQTRASKLQELVMSGQVDLSQPLIEQPDAHKTQHKQLLGEMMQQVPGIPLGNPLSQHLFFPGMPNSFPGFPGLPQLPLMPGIDPSIQLLLAQSATDNLITTSALSSAVSSPSVDLKIKKEKSDLSENSDKLISKHSDQLNDNIADTNSKSKLSLLSQDPTHNNQQVSDVDMSNLKGYFARFKPQVHRHLLENIGFECVMQFNEYNLSRRKREKDVETKEEEENDKEEEVIDEQKPDIPEIKKHFCKTCGKVFSSVFVLKSHQEEFHKVIVPIEMVEDFGEKFKTEFEKKQPKEIETGAQLPSNQPTNLLPQESGQRSNTPDSNSDSTSQDMPPPSVPTSQSGNNFEMSPLIPMYGMMPVPLPFSLPNSTVPPSFMSVMSPGIDSSMGIVPSVPFMDPNLVAAQRQAQQAAQNQKRARTRISDDQLKILRAYFDINNSPSEEQIMAMSEQSGLPAKVIKHWFRNTLFKERQRNKDSPYNFNNPPSTTLDLEEYERTGKIPVTENDDPSIPNLPSVKEEKVQENSLPIKPEDIKREDSDSRDLVIDYQSDNSVSPIPRTPTSPPTSCTTPTSSQDAFNLAEQLAQAGSSGKRANRTRFTDYQIKMLQDYFEQNAYPKDDELDHLSKLLNLSPRVIVVWFQNARQKARKLYENQPSESTPKDSSTLDDGNSYERNAGLTYQCKKCNAVFQRYYELIKHQRHHCPHKSEQPSSSNSNGNDSDSLDADCEEEEEERGDKLHSPKHKESVNENLDKGKPMFKCEKCNLEFHRLDQWQEHQNVHVLNPSLFSNFSMNSALGMLQSAASQQQKQQLQQLHLQQQPQFDFSSSLSSLRKSMDEDDRDDQPRDKRLRTTILPEQLDYLYQKYQVDCNPSRKQLESIASDVGLKKRVVQVWFQNTRARERKGQFRAHQQLIHKRCPFCKALFRAKSALESHLATKHPEEMARGEVNIDNIPDAVIDGNSESNTPQMSMSVPSSVPQPSTNDLSKLFSPPPGMQQLFPFMPSPGMPIPGSLADPLQLTMKQFYEDSYKKFFNELSGASHSKKLSTGDIPQQPPPPPPPPPPPSATSLAPSSKHQPYASYESNDAPLDLSKPIKVSTDFERTIDGPLTDLSERSHDDSRMHHNFNDSISETYSESMDGMGDGDSSPSSPCNLSQHVNKRYRTQMSSLQIKVMKSLFLDYKTPTMAECEMLGNHIGLQKRVVQVWFQNARAKEKKCKLTTGKSLSDVDYSKPPEQCKLCNFKYSHKYTVQDHIFTKKHIENVRVLLQSQNETEKDLANPILRQQQDLERMKKAWDEAGASSSNPSLPMGVSGLGVSGSFGGLGKQSFEVKSEKSQKENDRKSMEIKTEGTRKINEDFLSHQMMNPFASFMPPGIDPAMMPMMYPNLPGYVPGMGLPMMQPGVMPGAEQLMAYDPLTFGTPLVLLQIPQQSIKDVTLKLSEKDSTVAQYTQDCKSMNDLKSMVCNLDYACAGESMVDVGFICKKCQMVYPAKEACLNHQKMLCFPMGKLPDNFQPILKLEQIQYECRACAEKFSTLQEYKMHCQVELHKTKSNKLRQKALSPTATDSVSRISRNPSGGSSNNSKVDLAKLNTSPSLKLSRQEDGLKEPDAKRPKLD